MQNVLFTAGQLALFYAHKKQQKTHEQTRINKHTRARYSLDHVTL